MAGNHNSGRNPKTEAQRNLHDSRERPHHRNAPKYQKAMPSKPPIVARDTIADAKWDELGARLFAAGVIDESHGDMLAMLCIAWADLDRAREQFEAMSYAMILGVRTHTNADGELVVDTQYAKANPLAGRIEKLSFQVARFLGEFGLTPISQAKVVGEQLADKAADPLATLLAFDGGKARA